MAFLDIVFTVSRAKHVDELPAGAGPSGTVAPGVSLLDAVTALYNGAAPVMPASPSQSITAFLQQYLDVPVSTRLATTGYTVPDNVSVAAIKLKTDSLTFTLAGKVDSNILAVKGSVITGAGTVGAPWGP